MNFFKDLIEAGVYDTTNYIHSECMKFVFMALLQRELDVICDTWNSHRVRNTNTTDATIHPAEWPDIYFTYSDNYLHSLNHQDITFCNKAILVSRTRVRSSVLNW